MLINWFTSIFTCTLIKKLINFVVIVSTLYVHWLEKKSIYEMILISPDFFWLTVLWIFYWFRNMKYMYMNSYSELVLSVALIRGIKNFFFFGCFFHLSNLCSSSLNLDLNKCYMTCEYWFNFSSYINKFCS